MTRELQNEVEMLEQALRSVSTHFDEFIAACVDGTGKTKAPSTKDLMRARGVLPPYCKMAFNHKRNDPAPVALITGR